MRNIRIGAYNSVMSWSACSLCHFLSSQMEIIEIVLSQLIENHTARSWIGDIRSSFSLEFLSLSNVEHSCVNFGIHQNVDKLRFVVSLFSLFPNFLDD